MGATPPVPPQKKSFADLVDYDAQFEALARKGILFSDADKIKFRTICDETLRDFDGNATITKDLGATGTNLVYMFFAFIQSLITGFDVNHIGDSFSAATTNADEKSKLHMLQEASFRIYTRFKAEGGSFAQAAEWVSSQKIVSGQDQSAPELLESGFYCQIRKSIHLPWGTSPNIRG